MEQLDSFKFDLSNPIKIQSNIDGKNKFVECEQLHLSAPSLQQMRYSITLKKLFMEAMFSIGQSYSKQEADKALGNSDDSSSTQDAKGIIMALYMAKDFDILKFFEEFQSFLVSGVCFTDKHMTDRIKPSYLDKISQNDLENLIGKYIEVFFISSWMQTLS